MTDGFCLPNVSLPVAHPSSLLGRFVRRARHAVLDASRTGRASEIAAWANALSAIALGVGAAALTWGKLSLDGAWIGGLVFVVSFVVLRLSLAHRITVWIAGALGTLTVASIGGALAWLFAHVVDLPALPSVAAVLGALAAAAVPAWAYLQLARSREEGMPDSLVDPVSMPTTLSDRSSYP